MFSVRVGLRHAQPYIDECLEYDLPGGCKVIDRALGIICVVAEERKVSRKSSEKAYVFKLNPQALLVAVVKEESRNPKSRFYGFTRDITNYVLAQFLLHNSQLEKLCNKVAFGDFDFTSVRSQNILLERMDTCIRITEKDKEGVNIGYVVPETRVVLKYFPLKRSVEEMKKMVESVCQLSSVFAIFNDYGLLVISNKLGGRSFWAQSDRTQLREIKLNKFTNTKVLKIVQFSDIMAKFEKGEWTLQGMPATRIV